MYQTDLNIIAIQAEVMEEENILFVDWLKNKDNDILDGIVHEINDNVSAAIDCTQCGNCCSALVINVSKPDMESCALALNLEPKEFKEKYIEESQQGALFINSIPCHFFKDKKCTIYANRFTDCREFPHLHKTGFRDRLPGTLMHYGRCPIIYNVLEELKEKLGYLM